MTDSGNPLNITTRWTQIDALRGDNADSAWNWFVDRYRPFVRGVLRATLQTHADAAPAEDEFWGYVYLSGAIHRADRERRFRAFLSGTVRNFARAWRRKRQGDATPTEPLPEPLQELDSEFELGLWADTLITIGLDALEKENPRTAAAMVAFYGLPRGGNTHGPRSASEVGELIGCSAQAVYMLLMRGRERLRQLLEQELQQGCSDAESVRDELKAVLLSAQKRHPGLVRD
jgi:RNA polymerase sigma factor (sigma-70 family)